MLTMLKSKGGYVFEYEDSEAVANETANINTEWLHTQRDTASKREIGGLSGNLFKVFSLILIYLEQNCW